MGYGCCSKGAACTANKGLTQPEQQMKDNIRDLDEHVKASASLPRQGHDLASSTATLRVAGGEASAACPSQVGCTPPVLSCPSQEALGSGEKKCEKKCCDLGPANEPVRQVEGADSRVGDCCTTLEKEGIPTVIRSCCSDKVANGAGDASCAVPDEIDNGINCNSGTGSWICSSSTSTTECCNGKSYAYGYFRDTGH